MMQQQQLIQLPLMKRLQVLVGFINKNSAEEFHFIYFKDSIFSSPIITTIEQTNEGKFLLFFFY
jgi:hypothetical protein